MTRSNSDHIMLFPRKSAFSVFLAVIFGLFVVIFQSWPFFSNDITNRNGDMVFRDAGFLWDSNIHLGLINEITERFPPTNFAAGGTPLHNYHYYFDAFWALLAKVSGFSPLFLYYRVMPVVVSSLLVLVIFLTLRRLTKSYWVAAFGIIWTVFGTSFGVLAPLVKILTHGNMVSGLPNVFMTDQIYTMLVNPQGVTSLIFFLVLYLLIDSYEKKPRWQLLVFLAVLLGLSFGFKAYGGVVFAVAAGAAGCFRLLTERDWKLLGAVMLGLGLMIISIRSIISTGVAGITFAPGWILDKMVGDADRLNEPGWLLAKGYYQVNHNVLRLALISGVETAVYIIGNLGLRLAGLGALFYYLRDLSRLSAGLVFLLSAGAVSFFVPLLFNQSKSAYNIIQFSPYALLLLGLMFTVAFEIGSRRIQKTGGKVALIVGVTLVFLGLVFREVQDTFHGTKDVTKFDRKTLAALGYVRQNTPSGVLFLVDSRDFPSESLWFTALSGRRTVYSGGYFIDLAGGDHYKFEAQAEKMLTGDEPNPTFDYLLATYRRDPRFDKIMRSYSLQLVYSNDRTYIYHRI